VVKSTLVIFRRDVEFALIVVESADIAEHARLLADRIAAFI
jgi:hypothetical protein